MADVKRLKETMADKGTSVTFLAQKMGIARETLYNRFESGDFKASEIEAITCALCLTRKDRDDIFFAKQVN